MSDRMLVATRKGLLTLARRNGGWRIAATDFPGVAVTATLRDTRDGALYAVLRHGHFGIEAASLRRRRQELERAAGAGVSRRCRRRAVAVPGLDAGGRRRRPAGRLWAGAIPAGLFRSDDRGASWQLVRALWDVPERAKWFGGGYDDAGIHIDLGRSARLRAACSSAISCGGVWETRNDGASWTLLGEGMIAAYMPPEQAGTKEVQDPHRVARCPAAPDIMWMQHHCGIFRSTDAGATWTQLKPPGDDFGFAVAAHPRRSADRVVRAGASRTRCACRAAARLR